MSISGFMVYWTDITAESSLPCSFSKHFEMSEMNGALQFMDKLRNDPALSYITLVSQNPDSVGKPGVSDKLPDDYSWSKQHRAGAERGKINTIIGGKSNG